MSSDSQFWREAVKVWLKENLVNYIEKDLDRKIKRDRVTKLTVFFTGLSAYLEPINLFLKGESGIGKTYNAVTSLESFPQEDIWYLGGLSPKALIHERGVLYTKDGEPLGERPKKPRKEDYPNKELYRKALEDYREELKAYIKERMESYVLINLEHKILVFLESPDIETFRMLLPLLSHDKKEIMYRYVDKETHETMVVKLRGFPSAIFCTTDKRYFEDLSTRSFTVTPESTPLKFEEVNKAINERLAYPYLFEKEPISFRVIQELIKTIRKEFLENNLDVIIPFENLYEIFPKEIPRDMRDFNHFGKFLKTITALHLFQRPIIEIDGKKYLVSSIKDVETAISIYSEIFETTKTGTEERILKFYHDIVANGENWTIQELTRAYNEKAEKKVSSRTINNWLERLLEIGYVDVKPCPEDKRVNWYNPLVKNEMEKRKNLAKMENAEILRGFLAESLKNWLKINEEKGMVLRNKISTYKILDEEKGIWGETEITFQEFINMVLSDSVKDENLFRESIPFSSLISKEEIKLESKKETEIPAFPNFAESCNNLEVKEQKIGFSEEGPKEVDDWNNEEWFKWKRIKPNEPCEYCGSYPTEYLIHVKEWGTTLRRCEKCFNNFRKMFGGLGVK